jgi:hypothetical protein
MVQCGYRTIMVSVVGVHGIWQRRKTAEILAKEWSRALTQGLREYARGTRTPDIIVPHLSPLLIAARPTLGPGDDLDDLETLTAEEIRFIELGLNDVLNDLDADEIDHLAALAQTLAGLPAFPTRQGMRALAAVDGRWRGGGRLVLRLLREVHAYLERPEVGAQVRRRVKVNAAHDTRVLLAHSLGSVIAYDVLRRDELPQVTALVTFGSPLAWPTVRQSLMEQLPHGPGERGLPGVNWTNVHDRRDAVTAGVALRQVWNQVTDYSVTNPLTDAHGASGYLRQQPLVRAVIDGTHTLTARHPPWA